MDPEDLEPFRRYLEQLRDDPVRIAILAAANFVEEMLEAVIAEAVPNSDCFEVPKMRFVDKVRIVRKIAGEDEQFWPLVSALNDLRAAAAHRDYEQLRDERFEKLAAAAKDADHSWADREAILRSVAGFCFGYLSRLKEDLRDRR